MHKLADGAYDGVGDVEEGMQARCHSESIVSNDDPVTRLMHCDLRKTIRHDTIRHDE